MLMPASTWFHMCLTTNIKTESMLRLSSISQIQDIDFPNHINKVESLNFLSISSGSEREKTYNDLFL